MPTDDAWERADELDLTDRLLAADGDTIRVLGLVMDVTTTGTAWNLTVTGPHTYHVLAGDESVLVHNECGPVDELLRAGAELDRNGLTAAGRALQKHGDRAGSAFPGSAGTAAQRNAQGQAVLESILTDPARRTIHRTHPQQGQVVEIYSATGRGVQYSADGRLIGFLEP